MPNDPYADNDCDGLSAFKETTYGADCDKVDSDADGTDDAEEAAQGSFPNKSNDGGNPPEQFVEVRLTTGDDSGSRSEKYELVVGPITHRATEFGQLSHADYRQFRRDTVYEIRLVHTGTILEDGPDYDYTALIELLQPAGLPVLICDPYGILGVHYDRDREWFEHTATVCFGYPQTALPTVDLNVNNTPENLEVTPGVYIAIGGGVQADLKIISNSPVIQGTVQLVVPKNIRVWESAARDKRIEDLSWDIAAKEVCPPNVFIEAIGETCVSKDPAEGKTSYWDRVSLAYNNPRAGCVNDELKVNVVQVELDGAIGENRIPDEQEVAPGVPLIDGTTKLIVEDPLVREGVLKLSWPAEYGKLLVKIEGMSGGNSISETDGELELDCSVASYCWPQTFTVTTLMADRDTTCIPVTLKHSLVTNYADTVNLTMIKIDIQQTELNVHWKQPYAVLNLTPGSYLGDDPGSVIWSSSPAGLSDIAISPDCRTFTFCPSKSTPGEYVINARSSLQSDRQDSCTVRVLKVEIQQPEATCVRWDQVWGSLTLTPSSYLGGTSGGVLWSCSPAGLSDIVIASDVPAFTFNRSTSAPGEYVVKAVSTLLTDCQDSCTVRVLKVELPRDAEPSENNILLWKASGLSSIMFQLRPDPIDADVNWTITGFPATPETKIVWDPWDFIDGHLDVGYGPSPDLTVTYEDVLPDYDDFMPPDNTWFGEKNVNVTVNGTFTEDHPVWVYFFVSQVRKRLSDGKLIAAWYFYWKQGAVTILNDFEYVHDLGIGVAASHNYTCDGDIYKIAYCAAGAGAMKPVFDTNAGTYTEDEYAEHQGDGIHGIAKLCAHEKWHAVLAREVRYRFLGGFGHADSDDDGLSDARELEIGTNPYDSDSCDLSDFIEDGADYSDYEDTADQELFCRWKQDGNTGDESKDWAFPGMQSYNKPHK